MSSIICYQPGQSCLLHPWLSPPEPSQLPFGGLHFRFLSCVPPPQVTEQLFQSVHLFQLPIFLAKERCVRLVKNY